MRRNIVIIGIVISAIAAFMFIIGTASLRNTTYSQLFDFINYGKYDEQLNMYNAIGGIGLILLFIGIPMTIIGSVLKNREKVPILHLVSNRLCPKCGREISFDVIVCPYCQHVLTNKDESKT